MQNSSKQSRVWPAKVPENVSKCASLLAGNKLVAFPTETVYGLGAHALDKNAILSIFLTKKRPLTDPLIVHIFEKQMAKDFFDLTSEETGVFERITGKFWPGPLTIVARARESIPKELCANTGFVGVRFPQHQLTLDLLKQSGVPVAAPSANLFGHVSPTKAEHVFKDFTNSDIDILDGGSTPFGIESSVIKLTSTPATPGQTPDLVIEVLRNGSVSFKMLRDFVDDFNTSRSPGSPSLSLLKKRKIVSEDTPSDSPGQFLRHYSPNKPSFILKSGDGTLDASLESRPEVDLPKSILIDFGGAFKDLASRVGRYLDLSVDGDMREAMKNYYSFLREVEEVKSLDRIFIVDLLENADRIRQHGDFVDSLQDKIFRSCEGHFGVVLQGEAQKRVFLV